MSELTFNADTHEYRLGDKTLISVTQLLKKHGLSPDYSMVDAETLNAAAEKGTLIHKEIEEYVKDIREGFTTELAHFKAITTDYGIVWTESETMVHNDIVAGTVDLMGYDCGDDTIIADIKTTAYVHLEAVRWQLSLYRYLSGWDDFDELLCVHLRPDKCELLTVMPIDKAEIEALLECERNGTIYTENAIERTLSTVQLQNLVTLEQYIADLDERKRYAEEEEKQMRQELLAAMEKRGLKKLESDGMTITYVAPSTRSSIDTAKLKEELPDIAARFTKETVTAASLRIKVAK